jgi:hypothetical protein
VCLLVPEHDGALFFTGAVDGQLQSGLTVVDVVLELAPLEEPVLK